MTTELLCAIHGLVANEFSMFRSGVMDTEGEKKAQFRMLPIKHTCHLVTFLGEILSIMPRSSVRTRGLFLMKAPNRNRLMW